MIHDRERSSNLFRLYIGSVFITNQCIRNKVLNEVDYFTVIQMPISIVYQNSKIEAIAFYDFRITSPYKFSEFTNLTASFVANSNSSVMIESEYISILNYIIIQNKLKRVMRFFFVIDRHIQSCFATGRVGK